MIGRNLLFGNLKEEEKNKKYGSYKKKP